MDPFADLRVSVLSDWIVVFAGAEEGGGGVDIAFVKDGVDGDGKEVAEGGDDGLVGVKDCESLGRGDHVAQGPSGYVLL